MRRLPTLVLLLALAALAGPGPALAADCPGGDVRPAMDNVPQIAQTTLCLINAEHGVRCGLLEWGGCVVEGGDESFLDVEYLPARPGGFADLDRVR